MDALRVELREASDEEHPIAVTRARVEPRAFSDERTVRGTVTPAPEHHAVVSAEVPGLLESVALAIAVLGGLTISAVSSLLVLPSLAAFSRRASRSTDVESGP